MEYPPEASVTLEFIQRWVCLPTFHVWRTSVRPSSFLFNATRTLITVPRALQISVSFLESGVTQIYIFARVNELVEPNVQIFRAIIVI